MTAIPPEIANVIEAVRTSSPGVGLFSNGHNESAYVVSCPRCGELVLLAVTRRKKVKHGVLVCPGCCAVRCDAVGA